MQDTTLFELPATVEAIRWGEFATSLSFDETQLIRWISNLHNSGQPFDLDPTYSTGHFWLGLPPPALRFDILPQCAGVTQADARHLPLAAASQRSIMFDPPFVVAPHTKPGIIRDRFSCYPDIPTLWQFYREALAEFWRLLTPAGILVFKCQDLVSGGTNYMTHAAVIVMAQELGYYVKDLLVLGRTNVLWSPNMVNQQHARKTHSYFLVLEKPRRPSQAQRSAVLPR